MRLKIQVYVPDLGLRELLKVYLTGQGHEVFVFGDVTVCPWYRNRHDESCQCAYEQPCADAIIIDSHLSHLNVIEFLKLQRQRGCKTIDANKAVLSAGLTRPVGKALRDFGCHHIKKPFRLEDIRRWLDGCETRLAAKQHSAS